MRSVLFVSAALLTSPFVLHAVPTPVNPLGEHGTSTTLSLQGIINARGNTLVTIASDADQLDDSLDSWWNASTSLASGMVIEVAGYAPNNSFGIYDVSNPGQKLQIFGGGSSAGATAVTFSPYSTFGFYLKNTVAGFTWYSDSSLNAGGLDHMVAYQGKGETLNLGSNPAAPSGSVLWDADTFLLGWEDLSLGDWDYNDMVVTVSNIRPSNVPDGASTVMLLGVALGFLAVTGRVARVRA
jgi:hypothetical protein